MRRTILRLAGVATVVACLVTADPARVSAYVLPVTDALAWVRNFTINIQTGWQLITLDDQRKTIRKMSARLSEYVGDLRARFGVGHDDPPRWRIHDFESSRYLYGRAYGAALNYGDAAGQAVDAIARPAPTINDLPSSTPAAARHDLNRAFATLDIADAVLRTGTHQNGLLRYGGRSLMAATNVFESDAFDGDAAQSTSAVLDKLNAAAILELKQKQSRNNLLATAVELAVLDNLRRRDTDAVAMNQRLRTAQHYRAYARTFFPTASIANVSAWRQP